MKQFILIALVIISVSACQLFQDEEPGTIAIKSTEADASVYIDEVLQESGTIEGVQNYEVDAGDHSILVYKSGLKPVYTSLKVKSEEISEIEFKGDPASEEMNRNFEDNKDVSLFDQYGIAATLKQDADGGNFVQLTNTEDRNYLVAAVLNNDYSNRFSGVVYEISTLKLNDSRFTLIVQSTNEGEFSRYLLVGNGCFAHEYSDDGEYYTKISDLSYTPSDKEVEHVVIGFPERIIYLRGGEMLLNTKPSEEFDDVLGQVNWLGLEFTNDDQSDYDISADIDDLHVYSF